MKSFSSWLSGQNAWTCLLPPPPKQWIRFSSLSTLCSCYKCSAGLKPLVPAPWGGGGHGCTLSFLSEFLPLQQVRAASRKIQKKKNPYKAGVSVGVTNICSSMQIRSHTVSACINIYLKSSLSLAFWNNTQHTTLHPVNIISVKADTIK